MTSKSLLAKNLIVSLIVGIWSISIYLLVTAYQRNNGINKTPNDDAENSINNEALQ